MVKALITVIYKAGAQLQQSGIHLKNEVIETINTGAKPAQFEVD